MLRFKLNKSKILLFSVVLSIGLFIGIVAMEKTMVKYTPKIKVLYSKSEINIKEPLDPSKFQLKEVDVTSINIDTVRSFAEIKDKFAVQNIYPGEALNSKRMGTEKDVNNSKLEIGKREFCLKFDNIEDALGGTLRKDDVVDIIYTTTSTQNDAKTKTITLVQTVSVLKVLDGSGRELTVDDKNIPATQIFFGLEPKMGHLIENLRSKFKIKLLRAPVGDKSYDTITIADGVIIQN